jgi:hypothetical protein
MRHVSLSVLDWALVASLLINGVLSVLHLVAGILLYVRDRPVAYFGGDTWRPQTPKQRVLLGGFLALSFVWLHVAALSLAILWLGNPLGPWLGVIGLASWAGQMAVMRGNDPVALRGLMLHFLVLVVWTAGSFAKAA